MIFFSPVSDQFLPIYNVHMRDTTQSHSLSNMLSLSLGVSSLCHRSHFPCRVRLQESQSGPIEQPINLKGGISTNKYIFIWMCRGHWVWVKIVQSHSHLLSINHSVNQTQTLTKLFLWGRLDKQLVLLAINKYKCTRDSKNRVIKK